MNVFILFISLFFCLELLADDNSRLEIYEYVGRTSPHNFRIRKSNMKTATIHCGAHFIWGEYLKVLTNISYVERQNSRPDPLWISYFDDCEEKLHRALGVLIERPGEVVVVFERDEQKALQLFNIQELDPTSRLDFKNLKIQTQIDEVEHD